MESPSLPSIDQKKEFTDYTLLKKVGLPDLYWLYWNLMLKGRA